MGYQLREQAARTEADAGAGLEEDPVVTATVEVYRAMFFRIRAADAGDDAWVTVCADASDLDRLGDGGRGGRRLG